MAFAAAGDCVRRADVWRRAGRELHESCGGQHGLALREGGRFGLLFANGGLATHSHSMVLGRAAFGPDIFPQNFDYQSEADAIRGPVPPIEEEYIGAARVETYTVFYDREGSACQGVIVARSTRGSRFIAKVPGTDRAAIHWLTSGEQEPVGAAGHGIQGPDGDTWWRAIPGAG